jgi:hypothetical protein
MNLHGTGRQWFLRIVASAMIVISAIGSSAIGNATESNPVAPVITPAEHIRTAEQTFLTYPEWFLVFSPAEYAAYLKTERPSGFPFWGHIGQFWSSYKAVFDATQAGGYAFNGGYHLMVMVIGISTTVEYGIKSIYENLIGRVAEGIDFSPTEEDRFAARYAQNYVDFIRDLPWYQYDFMNQLKVLWADVPKSGAQPWRKIERRFALTTELLLKAGYGKVIGFASGSVYEAPLMVTALVVSPAAQLAGIKSVDFPGVNVLREIDSLRSLVTVPRYERFTAYAQRLADANINFEEIAGNKSLILVSMIAATDWRPAMVSQVLIEQPILTLQGKKRVVATIEVTKLAAALRSWKSERVQIEHLFDY